MRHKKIKDKVVKILEEIIPYIKTSRKRKNMPFKEIGTIIGVLFPKTRLVNRKNEKTLKGFYKHVFIIYSGKKKLALKMGRNIRCVQKDYTTYKNFCRRLGEKKANGFFAKIYWRHGLFMLQKYGKRKTVTKNVLQKLKIIGSENGMKDVRAANIMKFGNKFKIIDAERKAK